MSSPAPAPSSDSSDDVVLVAVRKDGLVRMRAARTTQLVVDAATRHTLSPLAAHALGRALTCAALAPATDKDSERMAFQWSGMGPLGTVFAELRPPSKLRGYVKNRQAALFGASPTVRDIGLGLLPSGALSVIKQRLDGTFSQSQVPLETGQVDEDLESFFVRSEQVPTRVRASLRFDDAGAVLHAGGVLAQMLPGSEEEDLPEGDFLASLDPALSPEERLEAAFQGKAFDVVARIPVALSCACTRERAHAGVALVGQEGLLELIGTDGFAEVRCEFCAKTYRFDDKELIAMLTAAQGNA
jgi:molecular chaperone Hsp33